MGAAADSRLLETQVESIQPCIAAMKAFYSDIFSFPLPKGHRFPIQKYALLRKRITTSELTADVDLLVPDPAANEDLLRVHTQDYLTKVIHGQLSEREIRRIGFPWSPQLVERSRRSVGGTIQAAGSALEERLAVNLAGGTHHAHADFGSGFCVFNDVAVAARKMQAENGIRRVILIDCDVHQGDGSATIFADDPSVFTYSIHAARNFPFHKPQSDMDIALPDGTGDQAYLDALQQSLPQALSLAKPDLAIFLAGADPFTGDRFGHLALSMEGLAIRDQTIIDTCCREDLPLAIVMSGGYAKRLEDIVAIHFNTIRLAEQAVKALS